MVSQIIEFRSLKKIHFEYFYHVVELVRFYILMPGAHIVDNFDSNGIVSYCPGPEDSKMYKN